MEIFDNVIGTTMKTAEVRILRMIAAGSSLREIADKLGIGW